MKKNKKKLIGLKEVIKLIELNRVLQENNKIIMDELHCDYNIAVYHTSQFMKHKNENPEYSILDFCNVLKQNIEKEEKVKVLLKEVIDLCEWNVNEIYDFITKFNSFKNNMNTAFDPLDFMKDIK